MSKLKLTLLKEIAESQTGPFGSQLHQEDYVEEGTPIVTVEHLGETGFTLNNLPKVSDKDKQRLSKYILKEGDIVFSRVGSVDRCTYVSKNEDGWMFSGRCLRVRFNKKANARFVSFYFRQRLFKEMMVNISVGATMPSLNTTLMDNIPLYLPDKPTQDKIADVLSSLDSKIELNNRINAELEAMAKTIYDYWFVQFDFPDKKGKPYKTSGGKMVWNDELKREIPEGWEVKTVENLLSKESTVNKVPTSEVLAKGNIPVIDQSTDYISGYTNDITTEIIVEEPRIIFGDHTRILKLINFNFARGADGTQLLLTNDKYRMPQHLFFHSLLKVDLSNYGYARHFKFLKAHNILLPAKNVAQLYEQKVCKFYDTIRLNIFQNQHLTELRDWLLPMLMNGQVKVKEAEEMLSMAAEGEAVYKKKGTN